MSLPNLFQDNERVLTFTIANSHFCLDVKNILSFSDEYDQIQPVSDEQAPGFLGYLDYRDMLVNVYDSAAVLNRKRSRDSQNKLISDIDTYKQAHIDWMTALEHSINTHEPFTKPRDPKMCAFGKWYYAFETQDQDLRALLQRIEEPHITIHNLADSLLDLCHQGDAERAIRLLSIEKGTTLRKLLRTLDLIQDLLRRNIHPVVLHLTLDGHSPWFSIVLDEVDDIIDFNSKHLDISAVQSLPHEPVKGYLRHKSGQRYMMLCAEKLYTRVQKNSTPKDCIS